MTDSRQIIFCLTEHFHGHAPSCMGRPNFKETSYLPSELPF
ncbi:hypothetical protein ECP03018674_5244 [Escherichia coli P0301867.4]|uniref:Uncharacterized protein n=1 Tax=Escherichia coli TaxID=562 RepID=A0A2H4TL82_ECOLX|nr:hypothetical protein CV83915_3p0008 [Escherichia coli]EMX24613.1 hypothetical protein ECP03018671_5476 [Escherichia coli P0301867.1]ENA39145.1 hypothetical protein ECP03018672_5115 [Escherichia coli P0301867.2]ENA43252.1 hypothetical protein ECP03018674_5244 [Escherichia coli P0301867.4]ENC86275.1 hypothetical protein ECP030186711_5292 [Escherichia coli P0301867.11]END84765.1 hypothetical protein ECP030186713_5271 [Escherichia coli P0301867.13]ENH02535.1 hypothetical protein ECP03018677_52